MDPLSLTASIIAVVQVSHAVLLCCYRIQGKIKGAESHVARIIQEVEDFTVTLADLDGIYESLRDRKVDILDAAKSVASWEQALATSNAILTDLSESLAPFAKPGLRSQLKWSFESKTIEGKLELLEKQKSTLQLAVSSLQTRISAHTHAKVSNVHDSVIEVRDIVVTGMDRTTKAVDLLRDESKRQAILNWYKTSDPEQNHKVSRSKQEPQTARWIFEHEEFKKWEVGKNESLWLHGIPGAGKTILSSSIIHHLQESQHRDPDMRVVYYYFDFGDSKKQTVLGFLQSAVYQLAVNDENVTETATGALFEKCRGMEQPSVDELLEVLFAEVLRAPAVSMVVDALDECSIEEREVFLTTFMGSIMPSNLRILITSRKEHDIEDALQSAVTYTIPIQSSVIDEDVRTHVGNVVSRDKTLSRWKPALREEILEAIVHGSHGMFRWAICQLDTIKKCLTPAMVKTELNRMPPTLHQTYDRILLNVDALHKPFVQSALCWLAYATRPLTLEELSEGSVLDPSIIDPENDMFDAELSRLNDESKILELCGTLVTSSTAAVTTSADEWIKEKAKLESRSRMYPEYGNNRKYMVVSLSHYSVKEYISAQQSQPSLLSTYHITPSLANTLLAESCLLYLLSFNEGKRTIDMKYNDYPLLSYAARSWIDHWKLAKRDNDQSTIRRLFRRLFDPKKSGAYVNWLNIWNPDHSYEDNTNLNYAAGIKRTAEQTSQPLYMAAALGDLSICRNLVENGNDPCAAEGYFESPLGVAAYGGHVDVVEFFLEEGANPNLQGSRFGSVLHAAAAGGSVEVVKRLIDAGSNVNAKGGEYNTALVAAASKEHDGVVSLLLKHGADITIGSRSHGSSLFQAASAGDQKLVIVLLGAGADVNEIGDSPGTPLYAAAKSGSVSLIQTLLRRGADVNLGAERAEYGYPLVVAAANGHTPAVRVLIKAGANLNPPVIGHRGVSPLEGAIESRDESSFRAILDAGADPNTPLQGSLYTNAFQAAIYTGELVMARILLERGASVDDQGFLESISRYEQDPWFLEEILRTRDVNINAAEDSLSGLSAMHMAFKNDGEKVARLLLARKPFLDAVCDQGSILTNAISREKLDVARDLIHLGADVRLTVKNNEPFGNAVVAACKHGNTELLDLLISKNADIGNGLMDAISWACRGWDEEERLQRQESVTPILSYLLSKGCNLNNICDYSDKRTPLQQAILEGSLKLVRELLSFGAIINGPPGESGYVLQYAILSRKMEMLRFLLDEGAMVDDSKEDCGLLAVAVRMKMDEAIPLLLEKGASLTQTWQDESALAIAFARDPRDRKLVQLLIDSGAKFLSSDVSVLQNAISRKNIDDIRELLDHGINPNVSRHHSTPLESAIKTGKTEIVQLLMDYGCDLNKDFEVSQGPVGCATDNNDIEMVKFLLDQGADPTIFSPGYRHALYNAGSSVQMLDILLTHGIDLDIDDGVVFDTAVWGGEPCLSRLLREPLSPADRIRHINTALQSAAYNAKYSLCEFLVNTHGADVNYRGGRWGSPLQAAVSSQHVYQAAEINNRILTIEMLLARGADVNGCGTPSGRRGQHNDASPPLITAIHCCGPKVARMLLDAGADVNMTGGEWHSPLQCAAIYSVGLVPELLAKGAKVDAVGGRKFGTPLHAAAYAHKPEAVTLLLQHGAEVGVVAGKYGGVLQAAAKLNSVSSGSWTAGRESVRTMEVLLAAGADVNEPGGRYGSALQMAAKSGNLAGVKWLLAKGADVGVKGGKYGTVREAAWKKEKWSVISYIWSKHGRE